MKQYTVKFSLYGKNMKTTVYASSREDAKMIIRDKIIFHEISCDEVEELRKISGIDDFTKGFKKCR